MRTIVSEDKKQDARSSPCPQERSPLATGNNSYVSRAKVPDEADNKKSSDHHAMKEISDQKVKAANQSETPGRVAENRQSQMKTTKDASKPLDTSQIAATRTSLDHTINVSNIFLILF